MPPCLSQLDWIVSAKVAYVLNDGRVPLIGGWPGDGGSLLPLTVEARGVCNGTAVYADLPFPAMSINTILVVFAVQPLLPELGSREGAYEDGATSDGDANGSDSFSGGSSDTLSRGSLPSGNSNSSLSTLFSGGNHWSNSLADDVSFSYSSTNTTVPDASEPEPVWADAGRAVVDRGDFRDNVSETDSDDGDYQDAEDQAEWDATVDEEPHEAVPAISSFNEVLAEPLMPPSPDDAKARTWGSLSLSEMIGKFGGWLLGKQGETQQVGSACIEMQLKCIKRGYRCIYSFANISNSTRLPSINWNGASQLLPSADPLPSLHRAARTPCFHLSQGPMVWCRMCLPTRGRKRLWKSCGENGDVTVFSDVGFAHGNGGWIPTAS